MMPAPTSARVRDGLKSTLDRLYAEYNRAEAVADPIDIVRRYPARRDREVVGFCAAGLAFGRVASVLQSIERLLAVLGPSPAAFVREFDPRRDGQAFEPLVHRWTRGDALAALVLALRRMTDEAGSIEGFFLLGHDAARPDVEASIESFSRRALALVAGDAHARPTGVSYFFPRPSAGSACKRLNLYLRWMVRADAVDLGVWSGVSRSQLVVPLDVHVIRLGQCLGLTRYRSPGWRMASEITASLRQLDPDDPVRYDFALCHVGMRDQCGFNRPFGDSRCPMRGWCRPGRHRRPVSRRPSG
ncbi:MAG TPA: TIGR02757 family protein, partial [Vicinamibacterales bacterium]